MSIRNDLPERGGADLGASVVDLIRRTRFGNSPASSGESFLASAVRAATGRVELPDRETGAISNRRERNPEAAALGVALLGAGLRYWANHRNDGYALSAGSGVGAQRGGVVVVQVPQAHPCVELGVGKRRRRRPRRWVRRAIGGAVLAFAYAKVRRVLDESEPGSSGVRRPHCSLLGSRSKLTFGGGRERRW